MLLKIKEQVTVLNFTYVCNYYIVHDKIIIFLVVIPLIYCRRKQYKKKKYIMIIYIEQFLFRKFSSGNRTHACTYRFAIALDHRTEVYMCTLMYNMYVFIYIRFLWFLCAFYQAGAILTIRRYIYKCINNLTHIHAKREY